MTVPWKGSIKQTRKIKSPVSVTFGLVEAGEIIGTPFSWQIGAASSERLEATSPRMAMAPSFEINLFTTLAGSPALDWSSSVLSSNFLPSTPPAAFSSSMASCVPSCEEMPKVASLPVSEANSPTRIVSPLPPPQPLSPSIPTPSSNERSQPCPLSFNAAAEDVIQSPFFIGFMWRTF